MNKVTECKEKQQKPKESVVGSMWTYNSKSDDPYSYPTFMVISKDGHYVNFDTGFHSPDTTFDFDHEDYRQVFCVTIEKE